MLASAGAQYIEELACGNMPIGLVEVRHHTLQQAEGDNHVELGALDPMNRGNCYTGPLTEHFFEE